MGVDYIANYGIGFKVKASDEISEEDLENGIIDYLDGRLNCDKFELWEVGEENYGGSENRIFISLKNPFSKGLDLTWGKEAILAEIERLKILTDSEFNEVGGLHVY